jgi:hypothetical protein
MKTKLKPTARFEKVPIGIWKVSGKRVTLESINAEEYPDLREAVQLVIQVLQSPEAWQAKRVSPVMVRVIVPIICARVITVVASPVTILLFVA